VARAIADQDVEAAKRQLGALGASDEALTRAKANLELARLLITEGKCAEAQPLIARALGTADLPLHLVRSAQRLQARCH
jgi:hypothetical protein